MILRGVSHHVSPAGNHTNMKDTNITRDQYLGAEMASEQLFREKALYNSTRNMSNMAKKADIPRCKCGKALGRGISARSLCAECRSEKEAR